MTCVQMLEAAMSAWLQRTALSVLTSHRHPRILGRSRAGNKKFDQSEQQRQGGQAKVFVHSAAYVSAYLLVSGELCLLATCGHTTCLILTWAAFLASPVLATEPACLISWAESLALHHLSACKGVVLNLSLCVDLDIRLGAAKVMLL